MFGTEQTANLILHIFISIGVYESKPFCYIIDITSNKETNMNERTIEIVQCIKNGLTKEQTFETLYDMSAPKWVLDGVRRTFDAYYEEAEMIAML